MSSTCNVYVNKDTFIDLQFTSVMTDSAVNEQGCFTDWTSDRDFPTSLSLGGIIVNATCQAACLDLGYRFAAVAVSFSLYIYNYNYNLEIYNVP